MCAKFSKSIQFLANFTIGMIGNETGRLLECVELYGKLINKSETQGMVRGNIAATSLKLLWKNIYSVKCYDKLNMNVFTLSLWEKIWWGLIYFDQITLINPGLKMTLLACEAEPLT